MSYRVFTIPQFEKDVKKLSKKFKNIKKDLKILVNSLKENPKEGTHLGDGVYKIRLANSSIPIGKSGGFRVITYLIDNEKKIYLLSIYSKTQQDTISDNDLREILKSFNF